jgi:transmembrane sensor
MKKVLDEHFSRRSAARWFAKLRSGEVNELTDTAFLRWLEHHPTHERDLERAELIWSLLGNLDNDTEVVEWTDSARETMRAPGYEPVYLPRGRSGLRTRALVAATAAAIVLMMGLIRMVVPLYTSSLHQVSLQPPEQIFRTAVGEHRSVTLDDGSTVELNTATLLRVRYSEHVRQITLDEGEALFMVRHDTRRPFDVTAGRTLTRAVGTAFNVLSMSGQTQIAVLDGKVRVTAISAGSDSPLPQTMAASSQSIILAQGYATIYTEQAGLHPVPDANLERIQSWRSGRVEFHDMLLADALRDFNRYSNQHVVIGDPALESIRISGVFRTGDVAAFTKALRSTFDIAAHRDAETVVLVPRAGTSPKH